VIGAERVNCEWNPGIDKFNMADFAESRIDIELNGRV
jgi:hypothetical protein